MGSTSWAQHKSLLVESSLVLTFSPLKITHRRWSSNLQYFMTMFCVIEVMKNIVMFLVLQTINMENVCYDNDCAAIIS